LTIHNEKSGTASSTRLTVPEAAKELERDLYLPGARLAGRVVGMDGKPAANVRVNCRPESLSAALTSEASYGDAATDPSGAFAFDGLHPGRYRLEAGSRPWGSAPAGIGRCVRNGVVLEENGTLENLELRLQEECRVEGLVLDPEGKPAAGATISARDEGGIAVQRWPPVATDASGRFTMDGLLPGRTSFTARTRTSAASETAPVRLTARETAHVEIQLRRGTILRVVVRETDDRIVGAFVTLTDAAGRDVTMMYASPGDTDVGEPNESEGQRLGPIPPGRYRVTATNHGRSTANQEVVVSGEAEIGVALRFGD
jgi:protocatechuate 3,4-dioxygenase beta subunit